jgi:hypothetical protein
VKPFSWGKQMTDKTYWEKLKDPRWQKLRLEAMQKANFTCEVCNDTETSLNVHHREYFKGNEPWEYNTNQLSVVCEKCHEGHHDDFNLLKWVSSYALLAGNGNRNDAAYLMAGFLNIDYDGMLCISCHKDTEHRKLAYSAGLIARGELYGQSMV